MFGFRHLFDEGCDYEKSGRIGADVRCVRCYGVEGGVRT